MKLLTTILLVCMLVSCKTKPNATTPFADKFNLPKDSLAFYFTINTFSDKPASDSFVQNWYSAALYNFKEPVLSQGFIGHNMYRFLWLRSFHRPVVLTLHQSNGQIWLQTKMLDRQPRFYDERIGGVPKEEQEEYIKEGFFVDNKRSDLLVRIADRKANIIYNKNISLSEKEWNEFKQFLAKANFETMPTNVEDGYTDGAHWVMEEHLKNRYHVVDYHNPGNSEYAKAGRFLISLSGLKEEIY